MAHSVLPLEASLVPDHSGICPGWGKWLLLSPLQVQPAAKMSTYCRETHRDTATHIEGTDMASHTDCHIQGAAISNTHVQDLGQTQVQQPPPLLLLGCVWHTCQTLQVHKHLHICGLPPPALSTAFCLPSTPTWIPSPLYPSHRSWLVVWSIWVLTENVCSSHKLPIITRPPRQILYLPDTSSQTWFPCLLAGLLQAWSLSVNVHWHLVPSH